MFFFLLSCNSHFRYTYTFSSILTHCKILVEEQCASSGNLCQKKLMKTSLACLRHINSFQTVKFTLTLRKMYQFSEADIQCTKWIIFLLKFKTLGTDKPNFLFVNIRNNLIIWELSWGYLIHLLLITTNRRSSNNNKWFV